MATLPYPHRQKQLQDLAQRLGLEAQAASHIRWDLLDLALVHPTASASANYEQLEFVGDAVIRMVVAEYLFEQHPELSVGEYSALRSILVSDRNLAQLAASYRLDRYLLISESARHDRLGLESRLAESFEAMLGALYLSTHTLQLIRPWLDDPLKVLITEIRSDPARLNYKAALQEWTQAHYKALPEYRVSEIVGATAEGDRFIAEAWFMGSNLGTGQGRSIKAAEQAAAQTAFLAIQAQQQQQQ